MCGYGIVGERIVDVLLEHGIKLVVIDKSPDKIELLRERGVDVISGDATASKTLKDAGILNARAIAIVMDDDAKNLFTVITARSLNSNIIIATRANNEFIKSKLQDAGASFIATPNESASVELFNELSKG